MTKTYQLRNSRRVHVSGADGAKGFLIRGIDEKWYFRVYVSEDKSSFVDYALQHWDFAITIEDSSASFYRDEDDNAWVDYSPEVLGLCEASHE